MQFLTYTTNWTVTNMYVYRHAAAACFAFVFCRPTIIILNLFKCVNKSANCICYSTFDGTRINSTITLLAHTLDVKL